MARHGKIERLPRGLRDELGLRVLDREPFEVIAAWINAEPAALAVWRRLFPDNPQLEPNNLTNWTKGPGFENWRAAHATANLAERCLAIAEAGGGNIARGAATMLAGQILGGIEALAGDSEPEKLLTLAKALEAATSAGDIPLKARDREMAAKQKQAALDHSAEKLRLDRREFARKFLKFYEDQRAKEIAAGAADEDRKLDELAELFFGTAPEGVGPAEYYRPS